MYDIQPPSLEVHNEYMKLDDCIPPPLLQHAVHAHNEEDVSNLATAFTGDRQGMANAHDYPDPDGELPTR